MSPLVKEIAKEKSKAQKEKKQLTAAEQTYQNKAKSVDRVPCTSCRKMLFGEQCYYFKNCNDASKTLNLDSNDFKTDYFKGSEYDL